MNDLDDGSPNRLGGLIVSRETFGKLSTYQKLLDKWNPAINLVSKSTLDHSWERHFEDSAQLFELRRDRGEWIDLGSGAGFPGLVLAILASEAARDVNFTLVESDARKCAFLRNVSRETNTPVTILNERIENLGSVKYETLSARALAPLDKLLGYAEKLLSQDGECLFLKGRDCDREIAAAREIWQFELEKIPSKSASGSYILRIGELKRA